LIFILPFGPLPVSTTNTSPDILGTDLNAYPFVSRINCGLD
jgi:hypothetical protein